MRFTRIRLQNWKNFVDVDVELQRRTILVGPNASGKSNLLDAFRFLHDIVSVGGGMQEAVRRRSGVKQLRCLAARRQTDVSIGVSIGDEQSPNRWDYEISLSQDTRHRPVVERERVARDGRDILNRPTGKDLSDPEQLTQTFLEQVQTNQDFREISDFFRSVRYLHLVPQLVREPDRSVGRTDDPFGGDFLEALARTQDRKQKARLRKISDALKVAVPQLREIELWRDERGTPHLRGRYEHWRPHGAWHEEGQFSDGTLRLLGLLWSLLEGEGPLLLEEPELSLHAEVVGMLPQLMARLQNRNRRQVLLSTHSVDFLADTGIGLEEVLVLQPSGEGTTVQEARNLRDVQLLMESGGDWADALVRRTAPMNARQLMLFDL